MSQSHVFLWEWVFKKPLCIRLGWSRCWLLRLLAVIIVHCVIAALGHWKLKIESVLWSFLANWGWNINPRILIIGKDWPPPELEKMRLSDCDGMEKVDMVISRIRKSRSANNCLQRPDFGLVTEQVVFHLFRHQSVTEQVKTDLFRHH